VAPFAFVVVPFACVVVPFACVVVPFASVVALVSVVVAFWVWFPFPTRPIVHHSALLVGVASSLDLVLNSNNDDICVRGIDVGTC
jgi:hypothetical protein